MTSASRYLIRALCLVMVLSQVARAEENDPFGQHYEKAEVLYKGGLFQAAIDEFKAAYAIKRIPLILFNIGQAHLKLRHPTEALSYYEQYQQAEPSPAPEVKAKLDLAVADARAMQTAQKNPAAPPAAAVQPAAQDLLPLIVLPAAEVPRQTQADRDEWSEAIKGALKQEGVETKGERRERLQEAKSTFQKRKERGTRFLIYGSVGMGGAVGIQTTGATANPDFGEGDSVKILNQDSTSIGPGATIGVGIGLRLPLSSHWEFQSRLGLGGVISPSISNAFFPTHLQPASTDPTSPVQTYLLDLAYATPASLFALDVDYTFRVRLGRPTIPMYFGIGNQLGGLFSSGKSTLTATSSDTRTYKNTYVVRGGYFTLPLIEFGGVFGAKEQWDLGVRFGPAIGFPDLFFFYNLNLTFGWAFR